MAPFLVGLVLVGLVLVGLVLVAGTARADVGTYEVPLLSTATRLAVLVRTPDPLRGFDAHTIEIRKIGQGGSLKTLKRDAVLSPEALAWLRAAGEYDLYHYDRAAAIAVRRAQLMKQGFKPLEALAVNRGASELFAQSVFASVEHRRGAARGVLEHPESGRSVTLFRQAGERFELDTERSCTRTPHTIADLHITDDGRWLLMTVRSNMPVHAEIGPDQRVFAVPLRRVLKQLKIQPPKGQGGVG